MGRKRALDHQARRHGARQGLWGRLTVGAGTQDKVVPLSGPQSPHLSTQTDMTITESPSSLVLGWIGGQLGDQEPGSLPGARTCCRLNAQKRVAGHPHLCASLKVRAAREAMSWGGGEGGNQRASQVAASSPGTEHRDTLHIEECQTLSGTMLILL